jgi:thiamine biosynthesis protein ThiS
MRIKVNGKDQEFNDGLSLAALLQKLEVQGETVAVEVNLSIVSRDKRAACFLKEGDEVEIVKFVGGGRG